MGGGRIITAPAPGPLSFCASGPSSDAKISTLPACGFSRRQPDLSLVVSAQPQLLAFSRFSLPITGMGSKQPIGLTDLQKQLQAECVGVG